MAASVPGRVAGRHNATVTAIGTNVQSIQRTSCPDRQQSSAAYLAAIIDQKTRDRDLCAAQPEGNSAYPRTGTRRPDASMLIWVEGNAELSRDPTGDRRGMIVAVHGSGDGDAAGSFIISYPLAAGDQPQHVRSVSGVLQALGWSILTSRRRTTEEGHGNTALLVSTARSGSRQLLWLAEPGSAGQVRARRLAPPHGGMRPHRPVPRWAAEPSVIGSRGG